LKNVGRVYGEKGRHEATAAMGRRKGMSASNALKSVREKRNQAFIDRRRDDEERKKFNLSKWGGGGGRGDGENIKGDKVRGNANSRKCSLGAGGGEGEKTPAVTHLVRLGLSPSGRISEERERGSRRHRTENGGGGRESHLYWKGCAVMCLLRLSWETEKGKQG